MVCGQVRWFPGIWLKQGPLYSSPLCSGSWTGIHNDRRGKVHPEQGGRGQRTCFLPGAIPTFINIMHKKYNIINLN